MKIGHILIISCAFASTGLLVDADGPPPPPPPPPPQESNAPPPPPPQKSNIPPPPPQESNAPPPPPPGSGSTPPKQGSNNGNKKIPPKNPIKDLTPPIEKPKDCELNLIAEDFRKMSIEAWYDNYLAFDTLSIKTSIPKDTFTKSIFEEQNEKFPIEKKMARKAPVLKDGPFAK